MGGAFGKADKFGFDDWIRAIGEGPKLFFEATVHLLLRV